MVERERGECVGERGMRERESDELGEVCEGGAEVVSMCVLFMAAASIKTEGIDLKSNEISRGSWQIYHIMYICLCRCVSVLHLSQWMCLYKCIWGSNSLNVPNEKVSSWRSCLRLHRQPAAPNVLGSFGFSTLLVHNCIKHSHT